VFDAGLPNLILCPFAHYIQLALENIFVHPRSPFHENLLDVRLRSPRHPADRRSIDRRIAPAEQSQAFFADNALQSSFALQSPMLFNRQESHAHAVGSRLGQREPQLVAFARKELMRNLDQYARAIPGFRIAAAGAAMRQVQQHLNSLADNIVTLLAADAGHKPDPAGVVLVRGVVETLRWRQTI